MGLIILFLVGLIICGVLVYIASEILCSDICECVGSIALFGAVVFGLAFLISAGLAFMSNVGYDGFVASNKAIYDSLTYQLESDCKVPFCQDHYRYHKDHFQVGT